MPMASATLISRPHVLSGAKGWCDCVPLSTFRKRFFASCLVHNLKYYMELQ